MLQAGGPTPGAWLHLTAEAAMTTYIQLEKTATFLGRGQQVGRIDAQLGALASGQGSVVLVSGGFGMGKTALLEQAMRMARTRGIRVFHGAGDPATQAVPLAPLLEALMVPADAPVDRDRIRNLSLSADHRFWLMRELEESLQRSAGTAPMLIVIDDLQWADAVSLLFLTLLSRRSAPTGIAWLLAFRPGELSAAGSVAVDKLAAAGAVSLAVDHLDEHTVEDIATQLLGGVPDDALMRILAGIRGHPFWLTELLTGMLQDELVVLGHGLSRLAAWRIPRRFARSVLHQLARFPSATRDALETAAILGTPFSIAELAAAADMSPATLLGVLRQALVEGVLVEDGELLAFRYRLVRETIDHLATEAVRQSVRRDRHDSMNRTSVSSPEHDWTELTGAEIRVARLAALGESNRTIGEHLFLSPHTVDSHLRSIFGKLGISSRVKLAHLAAERASRAHSRPAA
jgi:predicted ATPase/DNA-binding CsgD family transcriptional regulator